MTVTKNTAGDAPALPDSLLQLMAEVGPRWGSSVQANVRLMVEKFSEVLAHAPKAGHATRNLPYGEHPRQILDVYAPLEGANDPTQAPHAKPVLIFVHGGAFVDGDKDRSAEIYSNVCWYFARHGVVAVNLEFRLAPESTFPAGTEDIAAGVAWVQAHIARYGGDPRKIFLMGHSAGAAHAGHYAYDRNFHPPGGSGITGLIVVSGRVRAENSPANPNASRVEAYYGVDTARMERGSAVNHVTPDAVATLIAVAEFENPLLDVHCAELFYRLSSAKGRAPRLVWMAGHNHTSIVAHFNTAEDRLGREILAFMQSVERG
jgi:acetyl esterase